jgi:hypothetical protein
VDFVGIAILELEENSPTPVHIDRPETAQIILELVQSDTVEIAEGVKRRCRLKFRQALAREVLVIRYCSSFQSFRLLIYAF